MALPALQLAVLKTASRALPAPTRRPAGRRASNPRNDLRKSASATARERRGSWFLQTDPIGDKSNLNLYGYVHDDPVNSADLSGNTEIFIGGAWDRHYQNVKAVYDQYRRSYPNRPALYLTWGQQRAIVAAIRSAAKAGGPINLIGHSLGAATAFMAAKESHVHIDNLITVDPVLGITPTSLSIVGGEKPSNVGNWANVTATPKSWDLSDAVAFAGGKPSALPIEKADSDIDVLTHHYDFSGMFDKVNALNLIDQSYASWATQSSSPSSGSACGGASSVTCGAGISGVWGNGGKN